MPAPRRDNLWVRHLLSKWYSDLSDQRFKEVAKRNLADPAVIRKIDDLKKEIGKTYEEIIRLHGDIIFVYPENINPDVQKYISEQWGKVREEYIRNGPQEVRVIIDDVVQDDIPIPDPPALDPGYYGFGGGGGGGQPVPQGQAGQFNAANFVGHLNFARQEMPELKLKPAPLKKVNGEYTVATLWGLADVEEHKSFLYGIEVEAERVAGYHWNLAYWKQEIDGSLRNNGLEFISHPFAIEKLEDVLNDLYTPLLNMGMADKKNAFPFRTSIHTHANAKFMNATQVLNLIFLYGLYEDALFNIAGNHRYSSNFCVPLKQTNNLMGLKDMSARDCLSNLVGHWGKYSALNILPLKTQGTVEFRHHPGTLDKKVVAHWVSIIHKLMKYAAQTTEAPQRYVEGLISIPTNQIEAKTREIFEEFAPNVMNAFETRDFKSSQLFLRGY